MRYFAFAFDTYYPQGGMSDCVGRFKTFREAEEALLPLSSDCRYVFDSRTGDETLVARSTWKPPPPPRAGTPERRLYDMVKAVEAMYAEGFADQVKNSAALFKGPKANEDGEIKIILDHGGR